MATYDKRGPYQIRARVQRKGRKPITKTFTSLPDAREWAIEVESKLRRGAYIDVSVAEKTTMREALGRYREEICPRLCRGGKDEFARLNRLADALGDHTIATITPADASRYRDKRLKAGASPQTVRHDLGLLGRVLRSCEMEWGIDLPRGIITERVRKPAPPNGRDRRLVGDEQERLLAAAKGSKSMEIGPIIEIALETGARRGEIVAMRWQHINMEKRTWHIPITKTGVPRTVPLTIRAGEVLAGLPRRIDGRVWDPGTEKHPYNVTRSFSRCCRVAGIADLHFHDLRHEATSRLFEKGLNMMEVAAITGHKSLSMLKRYTHLRAEDLLAKVG